MSRNAELKKLAIIGSTLLFIAKCGVLYLFIGMHLLAAINEVWVIVVNSIFGKLCCVGVIIVDEIQFFYFGIYFGGL